MQIRTCVMSMVLACVTTSCASVSATALQYIGAPKVPPTDPASVRILHAMPAEPHERLGEIAVTASTRPAPTISDLEGRLRQKAGTLGADAVVVVYDGLQPIGAYTWGGWWASDRTVYTVTGRRVVAVAIKYRQ